MIIWTRNFVSSVYREIVRCVCIPMLRYYIRCMQELKTIRGKLEETSVNSEPVLLSVLQTPHGTMCDTTEEQANAGNNAVHKKMEE